MRGMRWRFVVVCLLVEKEYLGRHVYTTCSVAVYGVVRMLTMVFEHILFPRSKAGHMS
jgi:hypothetical protein